MNTYIYMNPYIYLYKPGIGVGSEMWKRKYSSNSSQRTKVETSKEVEKSDTDNAS